MVINDKESVSPDEDNEVVIQKFLEKFEKEVTDNFKKLNFEFLEIRREQNDLLLMPEHSSNYGLECTNFLKNRYRDILPYDVNRVILKSHDSNPDGYINASHISYPGVQTKYIAAQAPLPSTLNDFWSMIFECSSKCEKYWGDDENSNEICDGIFVYTTEDTTFEDFIWRKLKIKRKTDNAERIIHHLNYTKWPDHGCPNGEQNFFEFMDLYNQLRYDLTNPALDTELKQPSVLVHCSAGCGRTGSVIAFDIMYQLLSSRSLKEIDIKSLVQDLRKQRFSMVQTASQYQFLHRCIAYYCKRRVLSQSPNSENLSAVDETLRPSVINQQQQDDLFNKTSTKNLPLSETNSETVETREPDVEAQAVNVCF